MEQVQEINDKPPTHIATDWTFFLKHINSKKFEISSYFDKENWKKNMVYRMRVSHIYDPSHFWVVNKESEVDALHKCLHDFYTKYKVHYKIPSANFKLNMYCVTYTEGAFYRSVLVNIPLAIENKSWAVVFLIDFGYMAKVSLEEIYFMTTNMYDIPQFAIRATLSGLGPVGSTTWSSEIVKKFSEIACNKIVLCQVKHRNFAKKVLYLILGEYNLQTKRFNCINDSLVMEQLAKQMSIADVKEMKHAEKRRGSKQSRKTKLPFLSPSVSDIERGTCVDAITTARYLLDWK